jgi:hypothetical protein
MRVGSSQHQRGIALFLAVFALVLLSAIAMGLMYMGDIETAINYNYRDSQQAFYASKAGIEEARERMMPANTSPTLIIGPNYVPSVSNPGQVTYLLNPTDSETDSPWLLTLPSGNPNPYLDTELCHQGFTGLPGLGTQIAGLPCSSVPSGNTWYSPLNSIQPSMPTSAKPLSYKWVRINIKTNASAWPYIVDGSSPGSDPSAVANGLTPVCWDGVHEFPMPATVTYCNQYDAGSTNPPMRTQVYTLTSLAVTSSGARRMVQAEVAQDPPFVTNAAVDSQDHVVLNGQLTAIGYDYCSCSCSWSGSGSSAVYSCTDRTGKACDRSKYAIFASQSVDNPNASETIVAGPSPPIAQNQPWPYDISSEITRFEFSPGTVNTAGAPYNYSCTGSPPSCGTQAGQTFGVPPAFPPTPPGSPGGNWTTQTTYVPGSLQITGNSVGSGILVVDGDLDIHGGLQFYGLILVRGVVSFTGGGSQSTNIYGAVLAGQESRVDTTLGGSANIQFDYCSLPGGDTQQPPHMLAFRELMY